MARALDGVDAVFVNSPSAPDAAELQIRFLDLAQRAGVSHAVVVSQCGATLDSLVRFLRWHARVEQHLRTLDLTATVLRPNLFLQSLLAVSDALAQGVLAAPIGTAAVSAVDTRDIAEAAVAALTDPTGRGETHTLTGPRSVTHAEIARALSEATGRTIAFHDVTPPQFAAALEGAVPEWQRDGLVEDYAHYARGEASGVTDAVTRLTGHAARDVTDFARDHATALIQR